ncbi:MAG: hypoxanthine phosphoribosyltransferase [Clostridia bacterium]|nr:hypoxanthine phosphoribosyltransferase [Clostridia bacterium]
MAENIEQLYTQSQITERVKEMGAEICADFIPSKPLLAICVIKGAVLFYADLVKAIRDRDVRFGFVAASSYYSATGDRMLSTGTVNMKYSSVDDSEIVGADVLIVEDIIDTGRTLKALKEYFYEKGANMVKIATLLNKPDCRVVDIEPDYCGFSFYNNPYIIGYGLDNAQQYRNLDGVYKIK